MRRPKLRFVFFLALGFGLVGMIGTASAQIVINEIRTDMPGTDTDEYFELKGPPGMSLDGYTYIVIGDASTTLCGTIESVTSLNGYSIQADSLFAAVKDTDTPVLTGYDAALPMNFENSDNVTHMLVYGFTGTNGQDLDTLDTGTFDTTPWTSVADCVGLDEGTTPDCAAGDEYLYCTTTVGPDGLYVPGHVYRCGDLVNQWVIGQFTLGIDDTPGSPNPDCLNPPPDVFDQSRTPCVPVPSQSVTAQASVLYATGANLHYSVNGGAETVVAMSLISTSGDTTVFQANIPGQPNNGDVVRYTVYAYNANPDTTAGYERGYFAGTMNIGDLQVNDANGANVYRFLGVRVRGNVTVPYGLFQTANTEYYLQDATGGIDIFKYGTHTVQPGLGDDVTVEGTIDQYNGKLEVTSGAACDTLLVDINGPGAVPAPKLVTSCDDFEAFEGELVIMHIAALPAGVDTLSPGGGNISYWIRNCVPDSVQMFIDTDTNIPGTPATSQYITVTGIASQYDSSSPYTSGYEIVPRFASDIVFLSATGVGDTPLKPALKLAQNHPNPFGARTEIHYQVPAAAGADARVPVKLSVFDIQGRLVRTLVDAEMTPGDHVAKVDAATMGDAGTGIYFYRLEVGDQVLTRKMLYIH
jgi:hypothetical protein